MHLHLFAPPPPHLFPIYFVAITTLMATMLALSRRRVAAGVGAVARRFGTLWNSSAVGTVRQRTVARIENVAYADYRRRTLDRLEDEAREFAAFLERLRRAADANDFENFLKERRVGDTDLVPPRA